MASSQRLQNKVAIITAAAQGKPNGLYCDESLLTFTFLKALEKQPRSDLLKKDVELLLRTLTKKLLGS